MSGTHACGGVTVRAGIHQSVHTCIATSDLSASMQEHEVLRQLPGGYKLFRCHKVDGQRCGCLIALKRKPTCNTELAAPQCRVHGKFAAIGADKLMSLVKQSGYQGPFVTERPLQLVPHRNVSRISRARTAPVCKTRSVRKPTVTTTSMTCSAGSSLCCKVAGDSNRSASRGRGGRFVSGHTRKADWVMINQSTLLAVEVNGADHERSFAKQNDASKENAAALSGLRTHAVNVHELQGSADWVCAAKKVVKELRRKPSVRA